MTDERLAEIEKTSIEAGRIVAEQNIKDLISALRVERAKVESIKDALFLLDNMVKSGEKHTEQSELVVIKAIHGLVRGDFNG